MSGNLPDQTQDLLLALAEACPGLEPAEISSVTVLVTLHMRRAFEMGRASAQLREQTVLFSGLPIRDPG